jgi:hypothetical protein
VSGFDLAEREAGNGMRRVLMVFEAGDPGPQRSVVLYGAIRWILPVLVFAFACTPESEFELRSSAGDLEIEIRHSRYFGIGP